MRRRSPDPVTIWLAIGGLVVVLGAVPAVIGVAQVTSAHGTDFLSNLWIKLAIGCEVIGVAALLLALKLYIWPRKLRIDSAQPTLLISGSQNNVHFGDGSPIFVGSRAPAPARSVGISLGGLGQISVPIRPLPSEVIGQFVDTAAYGPVVHGRTFRHCEIVGAVHLPGSHVERSKWILGSFRAVGDITTDFPPGTCSFMGCKFFDCEFNGCTGIGTKAQVASLKAAFSIPEDDPQWHTTAPK